MSAEIPFNDETARILKFILDKQTKEPATREDIVKLTKHSLVRVTAILNRLENDPRKFLEKERTQKKEVGNYAYEYKLIRRQIVTFPLTAWITIELHNATQARNEIDRSTFEKNIVEKLNRYQYQEDNLEQLVNSKITGLIAIRDVIKSDYPETNIYLDDTRYSRQRPYLELLAADLPIVVPQEIE